MLSSNRSFLPERILVATIGGIGLGPCVWTLILAPSFQAVMRVLLCLLVISGAFAPRHFFEVFWKFACRDDDRWRRR